MSLLSLRPARALCARGAVVLTAVLGASCIPTIKSTFVDLSYPNDPPKAASRDLPLAVDAAVSGTMMVGYERPRDAGACIGDLAGDQKVLDAMYAYGDCLAGQGTRLACSTRLPWMIPSAAGSAAPFSLRFSCSTPPSSDADKLALALSLEDASVAIVSYQMSALGPSVVHQPPPRDLLAAFRDALLHGSRLLRADAVAVHDPSQPALSLSGGAANGAFVAGYVHALLWMREVARSYANAGQCAALDKERFGSAFGSSVGSLISLPLDLYFTDAAPPASMKPTLEACIKLGTDTAPARAGGRRSERLLQECALAKLEHDFVANEWELLCARPGSVLELLSPSTKSMLKFDPLDQNQLVPFFQTFGALTRDNAFTRTLVAADLGQGVLGALDERACRLAGMNPEVCSREAVLASVSEPVLAPPRDQIYSGLMGPGGEKGIWFDGGLQSVNPAARAVGMTNGKVLALNTFRALSTPVASMEGFAPVVLGTVTTIGIRMIGWETSYAGLEQHRREVHACELGHLVGISALCHGTPGTPTPTMEPRLLSVSVPDDIWPSQLFATGYTFDPVVMRGLFLWGERSFFRSRAQVFDFLDWCVPSALESGAPCPGAEGQSPGFASAVQDQERKVQAEIDTYKQYQDPAVWKKHIEERKTLVNKEMKTCDR